MADVRFEQATRIYPGTVVPAVDALDLTIADGEFVVLVGPSGSGKTTALRMLAGSALTLIEAVRRLHALDVPLADAVGAATEVPARIARRPDLGSLRPGADADIVVLDDALEIRTVFVGGEDLVAA